MEYIIKRASRTPDLDAPWEDPVWQEAEEGAVTNFFDKSKFCPDTRFRVLYDDHALYAMYRVEDEYLLSRATEDQQMVCLDSCVEFFVKPASGKGYCNFEFNCGGVMLVSHVTDHRRVPGGFVDFRMLSARQCGMVNRFSTLPRLNNPERTGTRVWRLAFSIPFELFAEEFGQTVPKAGDVWSANFYKCGNELSHPHWGTWSPVPVLNFHVPEYFAPIKFA